KRVLKVRAGGGIAVVVRHRHQATFAGLLDKGALTLQVRQVLDVLNASARFEPRNRGLIGDRRGQVFSRSRSRPSRIRSRPNSNSVWASHQPSVESGSSWATSIIMPVRLGSWAAMRSSAA